MNYPAFWAYTLFLIIGTFVGGFCIGVGTPSFTGVGLLILGVFWIISGLFALTIKD